MYGLFYEDENGVRERYVDWISREIPQILRNVKKILISPHISKAVALMLTHCRYTIAPPYVEYLMAVKSKGEIDGLTRQLFIAMLNGVCTS